MKNQEEKSVISPDGRFVERTASYVGFIRQNTESGEVEVMLGWEKPSESFKGHWGFPGGGQTTRRGIRFIRGKRFPIVFSYPESPKQTAKREIKQEMKVRVRKRSLNLALAIVNQDPIREDLDQQTYVYAARKKRLKPRETYELEKFDWFTLEKAIDAAAKGDILNVNVLVGVQAAIEWYMINVLSVAPDPVTGTKLTESFDQEMREEIERRQAALVHTPLADSLVL